ncbi:MAG: hypothetical protein ACHRHE_09965 [Tepidisphaerales bacterium]
MTPAVKRWLLRLSEVMLVLVILCLLAFIWLPAWIGARPGY